MVLLQPNLNQNMGPSIETDLNGIACEVMNRQQIDGLIAVMGWTSAFRSGSVLFYF
jgi:hypothetical protein